ncbi:MAG: aminoacyl-tRNA hydrolase [Alphaproteobacteria bacterium]|nr:aminoacyl-tRNA hydrolase [Alphaproteobacteria bacterium]
MLSGGVSISEQQQEVLPVWLIVGLGNPDTEHEGNRHNIGFMALDRIAADGDLPEWRKKFHAHVNETGFRGQRALLMKPQTYMNRSGLSVAEAAKFYKIPVDKIIVLHDELDLPFGKVRVKKGGGAAGHNGLKSIDADFGSQDYWRIRIGIGHPGDKSRVSGYVLSDFTKEERHQADIVVAGISRHMDLMLAGKDAEFMTKVSEETKEK